MLARIATPDATAAEPGPKAIGSPCCATMNASLTPGSFLISARFALFTRAPIAGAFVKLANSIPGIRASMPNSGWPVTIFGLSTPVTRVPSSLYSERFLSGTDAASGTGNVAATDASSP